MTNWAVNLLTNPGFENLETFVETSQYPLTQSSAHVKATSVYDSYITYCPWGTTDPTTFLSGGWNGTWLSGSGLVTDQRFQIDIVSPKIINKIYYENGHYFGGYTGVGVKNFTFWGSNTADFSNTTWVSDAQMAIDGWTKLTTSQSTFDQHIGLGTDGTDPTNDIADPKYITVTNSTAYRYYAFKFADNWGHATYTNIRRIELQALIAVAWAVEGDNATFVRSTEQVQEEVYSGKLTRAGADCFASQSLPVIYAGTSLSFGCWVYASVANAVRIYLYDELSGITYSNYHKGNSKFEWLGVAGTTDRNSNLTKCGFEILGTNTSAYFDGAVVFPIGLIPTNATDQAVMVDGHISNVVVTSGGSGYSNNTVVTISNPTSPIGVTNKATATPTIVNGVITEISLTNKGSGYVVDVHSNVANPYPTITITDSGGGSGASAICYVPEGLPQSPSAHSHNSSFAIMQNGRAKSWGYNTNYKLGQGASNVYSALPNYVVYTLPVPGMNPPIPVRIVESYDSVWILDSLGRVWGVGYNGNYELGLGDATLRYNFTMIPTFYFGDSPVVKIKESSSGNATCVFALTANGKCYRWGYNNQGQLGTGNASSLSVPTELTSPANIVDISYMGADGYAGVMLLDASGYVWVAGYNGYGNLSDGTTTARSTFQKYQTSAGVDLTGACKIWGGGANGSYINSYVMCTDGRVYAAGYNANHQLGNNTTTSTYAASGYCTLVLKSDLTNFSADMWWMQRGSLGGSTCSCFVREKVTGDIYGWGYNGEGDLGLGDNTERATATKIAGLCPQSGFFTVDIATCHGPNFGSTAFLRSTGIPYTVGYNGYGQLGDGLNTSFYSWKQPSCPQKDIVRVRFSVYDSTSAFQVLCSDGTLYVSGYNGNYELGNGYAASRFGLGKVLF
jgi:alpha-tubulin suppressor-like RCC1 family protein